MNRITLLAFVIIILVGVVFAIILSLPEKQITCKSNDGLCPKGCNYDTDRDCPRSGTTTLGEVKRCLSDGDCAVVKAFCGNPNCSFNDVECSSDKFCATAISKDYLSAWQNARVKCLQPIDVKCPSPENFQATCIIGECVVSGKVQ